MFFNKTIWEICFCGEGAPIEFHVGYKAKGLIETQGLESYLVCCYLQYLVASWICVSMQFYFASSPGD